MQTNHTNGPWIIYGDIEGQTAICDESDTIIAYLDKWSSERLRENVANARLIAAAPELLASLQEVMPFAAMRLGGTTDGEPLLEKARAAIAKATGE